MATIRGVLGMTKIEHLSTPMSFMLSPAVAQ
jgi:hypothetical protein